MSPKSRPAVVILEDDAYTSSELTESLDVLGFDAVVARTVSEFEDAVRRGKNVVEACIVDVDLGDHERQGGLDALEIIKAAHGAPWVAVYTAHVGRYDRMAQRLGADLFLTKSADLATDATEILTRFLAQKRFDDTRLYDQGTIQAPSLAASLVLGVNADFMSYLRANPAALSILDPRRFEEVVAEIWKKFGYDVVLTPRTRDGGKDVYAAKHSREGDVLYVIECKRYARDNPVGVEIVRSLYGVAEAERATMGILATTSSFTQPAMAFQRLVPYRLSLRDYQGLKQWLDDYFAKPAS